MKALNGHRDEVERRADELREKLAHTLDALDRRRHALLDVKYQVRRHASGFVTAGALGAIALGAVMVALAYRARTRDARLGRARVRALARLWNHPDWVAPRERRSVPWDLGRRLFVGTLAFLGMELIRRGIRMTLASPEGPPPNERRPLALHA